MRFIGRGSCPILTVPELIRQHNPSSGDEASCFDLLLLQRGRKAFVGRKPACISKGDYVSGVTVSSSGAGRFDLTCSIRTLGLIHRTALICPGALLRRQEPVLW